MKISEKEEINEKVRRLRNEYTGKSLDENQAGENPNDLFCAWIEEALEAGVSEPTAMVLSTVSPGGKPSSRVVLLKGYDTSGFVFYSNYLSRKGNEINLNPNAALNFFWPELFRQIRVEGVLRLTDDKTSEDYFMSRPVESRISAWVGQQSAKTTLRELGEKRESVVENFKDKIVGRPHYWGGYILEPVSIEFWQGRPGRFHDRILFEKTEDGKWEISRLVP